MRNKTVLTIAFILCIAAIVVSASFNIYFVIGGGHGDVLWNSDEAYLFSENIQRGYHFTYLEYPFELLGEYFYRVPHTDVEQVHCVVLKVTSSGIDRYVIDVGANTALCPDSYTPIGKEIYAWCPGAVCKWTGTDFKPVTDAEAQSIGGPEGLSRRDFASVHGWSKHSLGPLGSKFTVRVDDKFELLEDHGSSDKYRNGSVSVGLMRPGRSIERILYLDDKPREVSKQEYESAIGGR